MNSAQPLVLLIESEPAISRRVERSLNAAGFTVVPAAGAEEGLEVIDRETRRVDAVVAGLDLPGIGALGIAELLAEHRPEVPVLVMGTEAGSVAPAAPAKASIPSIDARSTHLLVSELRAAIQRAGQLKDKLARAYETIPGLLEETDRLRRERSELVAAARALRHRHSAPACPLCSSTRVAPILYGSERLNRRDELAAGRVVLGAARRMPDAPSWQCRDCDHRWAD